MLSTRQDPPHRPKPVGWTRVRSSQNGADRAHTGNMLSVVVPAKNEAASLPQLVAEIVQAFRPLCNAHVSEPTLAAFEIVVVDDGSTDDSAAVLRRLTLDFPELRPVRLAQNVGQSSATAAGIRVAQGKWIATLDADLQNDPADLAVLWRALAGFDAVLGWRTTRQDVWSKRFISRWANAIRNQVLGQSIRDTGCSVRIFSRELALRLPSFHGAHRFIGPLLLREGARIAQIPVSHRPRPHGRSHYNLVNRSVRVVVDLVGVMWLLRRPIRYQILTESVELYVPYAFEHTRQLAVYEGQP